MQGRPSLRGCGSFSLDGDQAATASPTSSASSVASRPDDLRRQVLKRPTVVVHFAEEATLVRTVSDLEERQRHLDMPLTPARHIDNPYCHHRLVEFRYTHTVPQLALEEEVYGGLAAFSFGESAPSRAREGSGDWGAFVIDGSPSSTPTLSPSCAGSFTGSPHAQRDSPSPASLLRWGVDVPYRQSWTPTASGRSPSPASPLSATPGRSPVVWQELRAAPPQHRYLACPRRGDGVLRQPAHQPRRMSYSPPAPHLLTPVSPLSQSWSARDMAAVHPRPTRGPLRRAEGAQAHGSDLNP